MDTLEQLRAGALAGRRRLRLSCGLTEFPREIFTLADTLETLDLSGNALSALPDDLPRLRRLRILFGSNNRFAELPAVLGRCPQLSMAGFRANQIERVPPEALAPGLRALVLTDNRLAALPPEIGRCTRLQKLMLAGNELAALPPEMAGCTALELLRVPANRLQALPGWLLALPRLAWLAFAGNPLPGAAPGPGTPKAPAMPEVFDAGAPLACIAWDCLALGPRLGEGASGVIHQALWRRADGSALPVALKLFKGALTSDGLPRHEMAASLQAGAHPALIPVHGRLAGHPQGASGLVMALVEPGWAPLAGPPSLDSCTRDVYDPALRLALPAALRLARAVASAACQLHARGINHGDLYAHNILWRPDGRALLGDFGAASAFAPDGGPLARALERVEVRAFACLLGELLARCADDGDAQVAAGPAAARQALARLQAGCAAPEARARPRFAAVEAALALCARQAGG